ncbi:hypothetical protein PGTUg99_005614 [Puccinia graminis f. sp. tritici]|uniref:Uncharacterized protein n=1 Tax=Puccinia graminis f. sp. tritici TaxID=56615 RepID=A0A5B0NGS4_PUCGR|nr:hypothetical protein PGTUg99_005614 [Puccinia graminis f. sp. tritici]
MIAQRIETAGTSQQQERRIQTSQQFTAQAEEKGSPDPSKWPTRRATLHRGPILANHHTQFGGWKNNDAEPTCPDQ